MFFLHVLYLLSLQYIILREKSFTKPSKIMNVTHTHKNKKNADLIMMRVGFVLYFVSAWSKRCENNLYDANCALDTRMKKYIVFFASQSSQAKTKHTITTGSFNPLHVMDLLHVFIYLSRSPSFSLSP